MTKGLPRSLAHAAPLRAQIIKQTIVVRDLAISMAGTTGVGWGTAVAEGLPEGNIQLLGAVANLQFSGPGGHANLVDTWVGDFAVGTTPADDGTVTAGDVDLIASTALAAATAEVSPVTRGSGPAVLIDNTAGALEVNVNLLVDDASTDGTVPMTCDGEIYLSYVMLGDD
tara:strand:- start:801 stop:1310 length:510 start_codon:yes stop_codon:yes gene_type:complete